MAQLQVDLGDLKGWSRQVERASGDIGTAHAYTTAHIPDGDFGRILELITGDYEALIGDFTTVLATEEQRLGSVATALDATREDYAETDARIAQDFGLGARIVNGGPGGFEDRNPVGALPTPSNAGVELPEVSFGYLLDKCCDLIVWVGGPDPREYVTKWIAGDVGKASMQAQAWDHLAECLDKVQRNLDRGQGLVDRTWKGSAAGRSAGRMAAWVSALSTQSSGCSAMAGHVRDMAEQAVQMAQVVVDIIKTVISIVSAALSSAYIPGWGQWKAIKTVKEAITLVNNARKVITTFWNAITMIKDAIIMIVNQFSISELPPAPAAAR